MWRSVRLRITVVAAVAVAAVLTIAGVSLLAVQREQVTEALDASLRRQADDLATSVLIGFDVPGTSSPTVLANQSGDDAVVQLVDEAGQVVAATANSVDLDPIGGAPGPSVGSEIIETVDTLPVEDDRYRILSRRIELPDSGTAGNRFVLHVATNTDDVTGVLDQLRRALILVVPLATLVLSGVVWWLVGRTLRPVEAIRLRVAQLGSAQLSQRVPRPGTGDEIDQLASTMNEMLDRLETSSQRQQQFVADASHELRSPLTRMRAELDVDRTDGLPDDLRSSLLEEIDDMAVLIDELLTLAASDAGSASITRRPLDLDDIVLEEVDAIRARSHVVVDAHGLGAANLEGDPGQLRRLVRNLIDNAARHATTTVVVELGERDREVVTLSVVDDGPGVPPEDVDTIFDRFARLDEARTRGSGGSGLGLAICRDIAERHGGSITVDADHRPGARFVVELPTGR